MPQGRLLENLSEALLALDTEQSVAWTQRYLEQGYPRAALVETLAGEIAKQGNDPHNQDIGLCMLEDYGRTSSSQRDTLLLTAAHHTAGHMKYGDQYVPYRRYAEAFGMSIEDGALGEADIVESLADDVEAELLVDELSKV